VGRYSMTKRNNLFNDQYNQDEVARVIQELIRTDRLDLFYTSKEWRALRNKILKQYKFECFDCKTKGMHTNANTVHHQQYVRNHPRYAMSETYEFQGIKYNNLITLCHDCHEIRHGYRAKEIKEPLTIERW